jgi:large conductance mechanosensitive channel
MPPIGLLIGGVDFSNLFIVINSGVPAAPYATLVDAQAAGAVTINFGLFINSIVSFLIIGLTMFLVIRSINKVFVKEEEMEEALARSCPFCTLTVPDNATKCPHCTSTLEEK